MEDINFSSLIRQKSFLLLPPLCISLLSPCLFLSFTEISLLEAYFLTLDLFFGSFFVFLLRHASNHFSTFLLLAFERLLHLTSPLLF